MSYKDDDQDHGSNCNNLCVHILEGFSEEKSACCCMPSAIIPCRDPDQYVFFDFAHPSQKAYEVISKPLIYKMRKGLA